MRVFFYKTDKNHRARLGGKEEISEISEGESKGEGGV